MKARYAALVRGGMVYKMPVRVGVVAPWFLRTISAPFGCIFLRYRTVLVRVAYTLTLEQRSKQPNARVITQDTCLKRKLTRDMMADS